MKKNILLPGYLSCWLLLVCWHSIAQPVVTQTVNFSVSSLSMAPVTVNGVTYSKISYPDTRNTNQPGAPNIPVSYVQLIVPPNVNFSTITIQGSAFQNIPVPNPVYPGQQLVKTSGEGGGETGFTPPDPAIYNSDQPYPNTIVQYVDEGYFDGYRHIITVAVYPVQYYPLSNTLKFYTSISFQVGQTPGTPDIYSLYRQPVTNQYLYDDALVQMVKNPGDINVFYSGTPPPPPPVAPPGDWHILDNTDVCEYMVVTNTELFPAYEELLGWKKRKGLKTCMVNIDEILINSAGNAGDQVSGIIDNAGKLREFLRYAYYYKGLIYVVLGGDQTIIPIRYAAGLRNKYTKDITDDAKIPTDLYFSDFNGNWNKDGADLIDGVVRYGEFRDDKVDFQADIYVSRMLCHTDLEVKNQVHKIIRYERNPGKGNYSYLTRALMTQADELQWGNEADSVAVKFPFLSSTIVGEQPSAYDAAPFAPDPASVISSLHPGNYYGLLSFFGHGGPDNIVLTAPQLNVCTPPWKGKITYLDDAISACAIVQSGNGLDNLDDYNHVIDPYLNYPYLFYTVACETMPYDNWLKTGSQSDFSEVFTKYSKAGPFAYIANTRYGFVGASSELFQEFAKFLSLNPATNASPSNFHIGIAEALSREKYSSMVAFADDYAPSWCSKTHNLLGCSETEMWTATPSAFTSATVSGTGTVTVNTGGITGATICVMSALDNGQAYHVRTKATGSTWTFTGVPSSYTVCITKHNYIPYIWNQNAVIQPYTFNNTAYIAADAISTTGNVKVDANVIFDAENDIILEPGFEVTQTWFEAK